MVLSSAGIFLSYTFAFARPGSALPRLYADRRSCPRRWRRDLHRSEAAGVGDRLGEGLRGFLGQVVPYAAEDGPVRVLAGEFAGIGAGIGVWCAVGVALEGDGGHGDTREFSEPPLQIVVFRLT